MASGSDGGDRCILPFLTLDLYPSKPLAAAWLRLAADTMAAPGQQAPAQAPQQQQLYPPPPPFYRLYAPGGGDTPGAPLPPLPPPPPVGEYQHFGVADSVRAPAAAASVQRC